MLRVGHLVVGSGQMRREVFDGDMAGYEGRLRPPAAAMQLSLKRRMVECVGRLWEDNLRPNLDQP